MFSPEVISRLQYYVYRLIDPRNGQTFYIGKGIGNRVFSHAKGEETSDMDTLNDKYKRIREIKNDGFDVAHIIHRHGLDEKTAFEVEAALIDAYPEVLNEQGGHYSNERGIMHAEQVKQQYQANETPLSYHKLLMININKSVQERKLYEAVRYAWKLNVKKAQKADYVLALQQGLVKGVFVPNKWMEATSDNFPLLGETENHAGRWGFEGTEAPKDIQDLYMKTRLPDSMRKKGAANPIRYSY